MDLLQTLFVFETEKTLKCVLLKLKECGFVVWKQLFMK